MLSLTPRFSEVTPRDPRLVTASAVFLVPGLKPLKRLATLALGFNTPLKQGVNDTPSKRTLNNLQPRTVGRMPTPR